MPRLNQDLRAVLELRAAAQGISDDRFMSPGEYVRGSLCVQAQDPKLSRFSIGLRTNQNDHEVSESLSSMDFVRTHVLRATWHYIDISDLHWINRLTAKKVISSMGARHRELGIREKDFTAAAAVFERELSGRNFLTREEVHERLPAGGHPKQKEITGHLLMVAELEGLVASGPLRDGAHTYALVDEILDATGSEPRSGNAEDLIRRMIKGHGPTSEQDIRRWCPLTLSEAREALASDEYESTVVEGTKLWWDRALTSSGLGPPLLLPTFDELFMSHAQPRYPRRAQHPLGTQHFHPAAVGGGVAVVSGHDIGTFKRTQKGKKFQVEMKLGEKISKTEWTKTEQAIRRFGRFFGQKAEVLRK